jgi:transposase
MRPCSSFANISALERRQLEDEVRHGRTAIRALMILLSAAGYPAVSIAELVGYDPRTVRRWIERFVVEGVDGLPDRSRTGRPGSTARVAGRLSTLLAQPKEAWTVPRLARALRWSASSSTLRRRLRGLAQWRRPHTSWPKVIRRHRCAGPRCDVRCVSCPRRRWSWPRMSVTSTCSPGCGPPGSCGVSASW